MTTLHEWLEQGPFAVAMSSGFFAFYAHTGAAIAVLERGFRPNLVAGSSAGAMVAGAYAAGMEPASHAKLLLEIKRADFWDPRFGLGVLAGQKFDALLRQMLPVATFEECRVPLRISVFDILARKTRVLDRGDLAKAIRASCAVPGMFHPVWIERRPYWDGGILDRPGIAGVPPGRLLYHHISAPAPWSREGASALALPRREGMVTVVIDGLPRSNPWRLDAGHRALDAARRAAEVAMDRPIAGGVVRVSA